MRGVVPCPEKELSLKLKILHTHLQTVEIVLVSISDKGEFLDKAVPGGFIGENVIEHGGALVFVEVEDPVEDMEDRSDILTIECVGERLLGFSGSSSLRDDCLLLLANHGK